MWAKVVIIPHFSFVFLYHVCFITTFEQSNCRKHSPYNNFVFHQKTNSIMVTRRDFLRTMSLASAGVAMGGAGNILNAGTLSTPDKKQRGDKVKIAYIGIGNRGEQII
jgi:hypothetical protein